MLPKQETRNCENKRELRAISDNHILTSTHNEVQLTHISRQQETHRQTKKPVHSYVALAKNIRPRIGDVNSVSVEHMDVNLSHTSVIRSMYDRFTRCMGGMGGCERPGIIWAAVFPKANLLAVERDS